MTAELGLTVPEWHAWLTTDHATGEDTGYLTCPCSRYGRTSREVAYWAIAATLVYGYASGFDDSEHVERVLDHMMSLAVNDHADIGEIVTECAWNLPAELTEHLDFGAVTE